VVNETPQKRAFSWRQAWFVLWVSVVAFTAYFCMYSFRKPFAVGSYSGHSMAGLELKSILIIAQLCGYALSKFLGIKFNSELPHRSRVKALLLLILFAEGALLLFAIAPPALKIPAIFLNGLPLGAVWGAVFSFLEGRRTSEILGAVLSCSYIVASGAVKSVGSWIMGLGVSESWMPAATGGIFFPVFVLAVLALGLVPPPDAADVAQRTVREPMGRAERRRFLRFYWPGVSLLIVVYLFQTAYRDFRDNYAVEIWRELGMAEDSAVFTASELPSALGVLFVLALLFLVRSNRLGLGLCYAIMTAGAILIGVATWLFEHGSIDPMTWMILVGLGLYLGYVPYGCVLFDRTIAALRAVATAVFLIYISDAVAYSGSVAAVLVKELGQPEMSFLGFFTTFSYVTSAITAACLCISCVYFLRKSRDQPGLRE
jgi:hypothetical protein